MHGLVFFIPTLEARASSVRAFLLLGVKHGERNSCNLTGYVTVSGQVRLA